MKGRSHIATNFFSAVAANSIFHIVDKIYSWHQIIQIVTGPQFLPALESQQCIHKVTYYVLTIWIARLPDIDQRIQWIGRLTGGHRGCTHSCLSIILLVFLALTLAVSLPILFLSHGIVINALWLEDGKVALKAIVVGWTLHLLADGLTRAGIPLFWPITTRLGFPPVPALRFKVGTLFEDIVLWIIVSAVSFTVGAGIIGL
ncbi:MAG: metal-dependent hydrolase [Ktedonobacteraceae bacterium]